jgi:Spy/CpxP family protein refolding chaperone
VTFTSAVTRRVTRQPLLWVALTLSLVLNLCFIAGAAWIRIQGPSPPTSSEERFQRIGAELALDPQQQQAFNRYSEAVRGQMQRMREAIDPIMGAARAELAKPGADEATVVQLLDEAGQARRGFQRELIGMTLSFLAILSPDQRAKFVDLFHQRFRPWSQRPQQP